MTQAYLVAAAVLLVGLVAPALVCLRCRPLDGLVALELAGAVTTLVLVCLAFGYRSSASSGVALVTAVLTTVGALVAARFLDREP
jgi:multisubunit Na+/H+ antiporter MnhF subunit